MPFSSEKRRFLVAAFGEEKVANLEQGIGELDAELKAQGYAYKAVPASAVDPFMQQALAWLGIEAAPEAVAKAASPTLTKALADVDALLRKLKGEPPAAKVEEEAPPTAPETAASPFAQDVINRLSGKALTPGQKAANDLSGLKPR